MGCPRVRLSFSMDRQTSWACASSSTELVHYAQTADAGFGGSVRTGRTNGEAMLRPVPVQRGAAADTHKEEPSARWQSPSSSQTRYRPPAAPPIPAREG